MELCARLNRENTHVHADAQCRVTTKLIHTRIHTRLIYSVPHNYHRWLHGLFSQCPVSAGSLTHSLNKLENKLLDWNTHTPSAAYNIECNITARSFVRTQSNESQIASLGLLDRDNNNWTRFMLIFQPRRLFSLARHSRGRTKFSSPAACALLVGAMPQSEYATALTRCWWFA